MVSKLIQLVGAPFPDGQVTEGEDGKSVLENIRRDPVFCPVCVNLSPGSALSCYPRPGLWHRANLGSGDWKENANVVGDTDVPPKWTNQSSRVDYDGWVVAASLDDITGSASAGCKSCMIIEQAVAALAAGKFEKANIRIYMMFRKGNVLGLRVCRVNETKAQEEEEEPSFLFAGVFDGEPSVSEVKEELASYELYTLPGK